MDFNVGDYVYFKEGDYEYESRVIGVNMDGIITIEHADKDGKLQRRGFGGRYLNKLDITDVVREAEFKRINYD